MPDVLFCNAAEWQFYGRRYNICDKINAFFQYITQYYINNPLLLSIFNNIVKKANATREFFADIL